MDLNPNAGICRRSHQLPLASRAKDQHIWQTPGVILTRFEDVEFTFNQIELSFYTVFDFPRPMIPGVESYDKDSIFLQRFRIFFEYLQNLAIRNMVHGFTEQDYVKFLRGPITEEVRADKTILIRTAVFCGSLQGLGKGCLGNVHADVAPVCVHG